MPDLLVWALKSAALFGVLLGTAAYMTLAERKVSAWIQYRIGPNRVGPWGLFQPFADLFKFLAKEEVIPDGANKLLFRIAPLVAAVPAMMTVAVIPFAGEVVLFGYDLGTLSVADFDVSVLYVLALGGLGIYGAVSYTHLRAHET